MLGEDMLTSELFSSGDKERKELGLFFFGSEVSDACDFIGAFVKLVFDFLWKLPGFGPSYRILTVPYRICIPFLGAFDGKNGSLCW